MKAIVSKNIRVRHPECFSVDDFSVVDDFCYIAANLKMGKYCHLAPNTTISGGADNIFIMEDFSFTSAGCRVYVGSDDFVNDIIGPFGRDVKENLILGDVTFKKFSGIGANTVVMPDNILPEGTVVGSMSFVPSRYHFEPWCVYFGTPIRMLKRRNRDSVLKQYEKLVG